MCIDPFFEGPLRDSFYRAGHFQFLVVEAIKFAANVLGVKWGRGVMGFTILCVDF